MSSMNLSADKNDSNILSANSLILIDTFNREMGMDNSKRNSLTFSLHYWIEEPLYEVFRQSIEYKITDSISIELRLS